MFRAASLDFRVLSMDDASLGCKDEVLKWNGEPMRLERSTTLSTFKVEVVLRKLGGQLHKLQSLYISRTIG